MTQTNPRIRAAARAASSSKSATGPGGDAFKPAASTSTTTSTANPVPASGQPIKASATSSANNGGKSVPNFALTPNQNLAFLGSPPLVPGEDASAYEHLRAIVTNTVKPIDCVEAILTRDFVDEEWEILRYRRVTANLIKTAKAKALADALRQVTCQDISVDDRAPEELASRWTKGDQDAIEKVRTLLDSSELTEDAIIAQAVSLKLDDIERLDRMVMTKEVRRDNALHEIERHRANFGARPRRAAEQVEEADFCVIEESPAGEKGAA